MKVFMIAGEASGDKLGAALMTGLKQLQADISFAGIGGAAMAEQGLSSQFLMKELSVMGIAEVLPKYRHLKRRIRETADAVIKQSPDVLITIDSPDFCLRVARLVRGATNIRTVHYVAPSVWAWRPGRAEKMAKHVDQVLALLPFEPPYMEAAGMRCDFVGHPVVNEPAVTKSETKNFRAIYGIGHDPICLVLPGSRKGEISRLLPVFGEVVKKVSATHPRLRVVIPAARAVADEVLQATSRWEGTPIVLDPRAWPNEEAETRKRIAFAAADVALAASGTVSLELSRAATPMVIAYDMNWLSWQIMSRMARIDTVTLTNLVTGTHAVPEFLGPKCLPGPIAEGLNALLDDPALRQAQVTAMADTVKALGQGGDAPGLRAARAVLDGIKNG